MKFNFLTIFFGLLLSVHGALASEGRPNVVFIFLDDLGYSQIEAYSRGLSEADVDPAFLDNIARRGDYNFEQAYAMMERASPTLSRMADQGVRFSNAFAASNLCAPARVGVATGILPNRWGIYRNIDSEAHGLKPNSHLAEQLQAAGYATAHIGKWHIGGWDDTMLERALEEHGVEDTEGLDYWKLEKDYPEIQRKLKAMGYMGSSSQKDHPLNNGFDYHFGYNMWESPFYWADNLWENFAHAGVSGVYNTDLFTDKALAFMEGSLKAGKPFYVQLHYHAVHSPLEPKAPDKYFDRFDSGSFNLDNFYAHVFGVDENVRRIEQFLAERGVAENTVFIFASDNGGAVSIKCGFPGNAPYRGHKGSLLQGGFRVPLFFYWPAAIEKPHISDEIVTTLDILPTVLASAGIELPAGLDGKSLLGHLTGTDYSPVREYYAMGGIHSRAWGFMLETSFYPTTETSREHAPSGYMVADDQYILRFVADTEAMLYRDAVDGIPARFELYDYTVDPMEQDNLIDQLPDKANELKAIWRRESKEFPKPTVWDAKHWEALMQP
jgi:uncharacterized sulfatase